MIKMIVCTVSLVFSMMTCAAFSASCPHAEPSNSPGFCASFKVSAKCYCMSSKLSEGMCADMKLLYTRMISIFGTVQRACDFQRDTSPSDCVDAWHCFLDGGMTSSGGLCNATGASCA